MSWALVLKNTLCSRIPLLLLKPFFHNLTVPSVLDRTLNIHVLLIVTGSKVCIYEPHHPFQVLAQRLDSTRPPLCHRRFVVKR